MTTDIPNPGSDAARSLSCLCPVLDNSHGRGAGPFWVNGDCPVHGFLSQETSGDEET